MRVSGAACQRLLHTRQRRQHTLKWLFTEIRLQQEGLFEGKIKKKDVGLKMDWK